MNFVCLPIIVLLCYLVGEFLKVLFKKKKELNKLIPIVVSLFGGLLGILIYFTNSKVIFNVNSFWIALQIGIISGLSSSGSNEIIKKTITKKGELND